MTDDRPWNLAAGRARENHRHVQCGPTGTDRDALASEYQRAHKLAGVRHPEASCGHADE